MLLLYHFNLCPNSRFIRIILDELEAQYTLKQEKYWENREGFTNLHPAGEVPLLIADNELAVYGVDAIRDYIIFSNLDKAEQSRPLSQFSSKHTNVNKENNTRVAKIQSLCSWFANRFYRDVTLPMLTEKVIKSHFNGEAPNSEKIRKSQCKMNEHLKYIDYLISKGGGFIYDDKLSLPDIAAAAQISTLDFLGLIDWSKHKQIKSWYSIAKSRPSFRSILKDRLPGIAPSLHYNNLDF